MTIFEQQYLSLFILSFLITGLLTPSIRRIAISKNILDFPNSAHKSHITPVPYLGGIGIIIGIAFTVYGSIFFSNLKFTNFLLVTSVLGPAIIMGLLGLWDDMKSLGPVPRLIAQTIAGFGVAIIIILSGNFGNPTGFKFIDIAITVVWVVGICNAINFFDNVDGGAAGSVVISASSLSFLAVTSGQLLIGAMSLVVAGSTLGFLIWNVSPARIYMGDAGALFLGIIMASLLIRFEPGTTTTFGSFATPLLLLAVPILDTSVAVISRISRKTSPFSGAKDHLSHRLIRAGLSQKSTVTALWLLSLLFSLLAIALSYDLLFGENILVFFAMFTWILLLIYFLKTEHA